MKTKPMRLRVTTLTMLFFCGMLGSVAQASPEIPGAEQTAPIALIGGTIHPVHGKPIEDAVLLFDQGRIAAVGKSVDIPENAERIDVSGKHVYPGLFDAFTDIGLVEINAIRATRDGYETGAINPNVKAQVAVNPDSEIIPVTRSNGVLLALTCPGGQRLSGKSAVLQLDGWTWEDMTVQPDVGMHIDWPRMAPVSDWWIEKSAQEQIKERDAAMRALRDAMQDVRAYQKARQSNPETQPIDLRWEAMLPVLQGKLPLIVSADDAQQIQAAVAFAAREKMRLIIYGGYDAEQCADLLKKYDVPVIIAGVYRLPMRRSDQYDAAYTLPARLHAAGVRFCISGSGRFGASNVRNLPYHAATAVAYGLSRDEAVKSITLYPAQILGVADRVGSLEVGKHATLFVADGDPLETPTQVEMAFVQGRRVQLMDRHKRLWKKYQEKYRRQSESR